MDIGLPLIFGMDIGLPLIFRKRKLGHNAQSLFLLSVNKIGTDCHLG